VVHSFRGLSASPIFRRPCWFYNSAHTIIQFPKKKEERREGTCTHVRERKKKGERETEKEMEEHFPPPTLP